MAELSNYGEKRAGEGGKFSKTGSNQTEGPHSKYNIEEIQIPSNSELRDQTNDNPYSPISCQFKTWGSSFYSKSFSIIMEEETKS